MIRRTPALLAFVSFLAFGQPAVEVGIQGYRFDPQEVSIRAGDTVRWVNREKRTSHSVLFPGENNLESDRLMPEDSWARAFAKPGIYDYQCGPHPEMKGRVTVLAP